jgi:hypothetical protein
MLHGIFANLEAFGDFLVGITGDHSRNDFQLPSKVPSSLLCRQLRRPCATVLPLPTSAAPSIENAVTTPIISSRTVSLPRSNANGRYVLSRVSIQCNQARDYMG